MAQTNGIKKKARTWVLIADKIADWVISIGGILVIGAVIGMMLFLVSVVTPLFKGGRVESHKEYLQPEATRPVIGLSLDEHKTIAVAICQDGSLSGWHASTGMTLKVPSFDFRGKEATAFCRTSDGEHLAFGFSDGTVRLGRLIHKNEIINFVEAPAGLKVIDDRDKTDGSVVYSVVPGGQFRKVEVRLELDEEMKVSDAARPIVALDYRFSTFGELPTRVLAVIDDQGVGTAGIVESRRNLLSGELTSELKKETLPPFPKEAKIAYVLVNELASHVHFAEKSGKVYRFNIGNLSQPILAETTRVTPEGVGLHVFKYLLGDESIVVGGTDGSLNIYFLLRRKDADTQDGYGLVRARSFEPQTAPVVAFAPSQRGKGFITADAKGGIWYRYGTTEKTLLKVKQDIATSGSPDLNVLIAPRQDGLLAIQGGAIANYWDVRIHHPEISLKTLFGKVWYEGYPEPGYAWQSTGATEQFEPKLSLVPLIFGTLKATFYSLFFSIPIAILAAIYTSEFLHPSVRGRIKPAIEVMASIPSVVLGYIAAFALAPFVETWLVAVILVLGVLPASLILAAYLWQMTPPRVAVRLDGAPKFCVMAMVVVLAMYGCYVMGPTVERTIFNGDFKGWLNRDVGSARPFFFVLFLPMTALLVSAVAGRLFGYRFSRYMRKLPPLKAALADLGRWLGMAGVTLAVSYLFAVFLSVVGLDGRGTVVDTYVQRNTLVVGFAMGFAVVPIIYTISEDAMNAVPDHLRSASLGCGATPWQTAVWVILPTALSGIFSAIMIGMGRAVGETMLIVMATGNTPLLDLNVFNGLRALSANIAVELPEAPHGDTLYRLLFLTGLALFAMTFAINTVAEIVRLRFRKRSSQL